MRQAIITKYFPPTNNKEGRVRARCDAKTIHVPWDDALSIPLNHERAALALANVMGWIVPDEYGPVLRGGSLGGQFVFVLVEDER